MGMMIHEMTAEECRTVVQRADFGRLACVREAQPYIVPIYFAYDRQHIYSITMPGQKIAWMRANPRICLEADERPSHNEWFSVVVFGRYEELPDAPEFGPARARALELLEKRTMWWEPGCVPAQRQERRPPIFYRIHIDQMTGRRAVPGEPTDRQP
jgi:nitroimidazol reductase NimA-like FMN-containing flavoprotein (pyridoxamine 5'-phosphate oxidase superfamily)